MTELLIAVLMKIIPYKWLLSWIERSDLTNNIKELRKLILSFGLLFSVVTFICKVHVSLNNLQLIKSHFII